jgi:hypothetical protein
MGMRQTNGITDSSLEASSPSHQQLVGLEISLHVTDSELCDDVVVVWDAEDPRSDVVLVAGLSVAKALCTHGNTKREAEIADLRRSSVRYARSRNKHRHSIKSQAGPESSVPIATTS